MAKNEMLGVADTQNRLMEQNMRRAIKEGIRTSGLPLKEEFMMSETEKANMRILDGLFIRYRDDIGGRKWWLARRVMWRIFRLFCWAALVIGCGGGVYAVVGTGSDVVILLAGEVFAIVALFALYRIYAGSIALENEVDQLQRALRDKAVLGLGE